MVNYPSVLVSDVPVKVGDVKARIRVVHGEADPMVQALIRPGEVVCRDGCSRMSERPAFARFHDDEFVGQGAFYKCRA